MKIQICNAEFSAVSKRLCHLLDFEIAENGIPVKAIKGDRIGVSFSGSEAVIYYKEQYQFFRELALLLARLKKESSFDITESGFFESPCVMLDVSRGAVIKVEAMKRILDFLAIMGYGSAMLYTEDTVELPSRPSFGYMRGRYTKDELVAIDDYAFEYGIEMIPCIECYGHMGKYLVWEEAFDIKDTDEVLLAREDKTFEFLDEWICRISSCFRSRKIHIGMDEAWDMGRGKFLDKNGYVPPFEIFNEYMQRLVGITNKYGLSPMMWSDMYFRISSKSGRDYYDLTTEVPREVAEKIPEGVTLVFWHYRGTPGIDDVMLPKHKALGHEVIHAGGIWGWGGHLPENNLAIEAAKTSVAACRRQGVNRTMTTVWSDDGAECDLFPQLLGLCAFIENIYNPDLTNEELKVRFAEVTGGDYGAFYNMCQYHNIFDGRKYALWDRFLGKSFFWQDILSGKFDAALFSSPMSDHYARWREYYSELAEKDGAWQELYKHVFRIFDYLAAKTLIAEKLVPAYKAKDTKTLSEIAYELLPSLLEKTEAVYASHKARWNAFNKRHGWLNLDLRYAGVIQRCKTAAEELNLYLKGEIQCIEELKEGRLMNVSPNYNYIRIASPTGKI